ncbi:phosphotransferase [Luteipulveratus sp. YIM 133132]|uniref:phosphotransferase family protein n=1 Tax=Luteipulveratus flavus TaxID=3031728 RepID=UPI0023B1F594|nr:phosphotransferase [Luteipulveratus sp. YIM 133132]MDE9367586.1 phosphotransferase [Luteipulveratus sp. YIM 133132]
MHPHGVDYTATSARLSWSEVDFAVVSAVGRLLGADVVRASAPVGSGFGAQYAGTLTLADGRRVFGKVAAPWMDFPGRALRREAAVLSSLPQHVPHARLLGHTSHQGWECVLVEHLDGRMPVFPWTVADLDAAYDACVAATSAPPPPGLCEEEFRDAVARDDRLLETERALAAGTFVLPTTWGQDTWLAATIAAHASELARLSHAVDSLTGESVCHNDMRPDNLVITEGRAVMVDWNFLTRGPAWLDFVCLLPMARRQGLDVRAWLSRPLLHSATDQQVDILLANIAVYMLSTQERPLPAGCTPAMRRHQLVYAHDFTRFLADRRGWR